MADTIQKIILTGCGKTKAKVASPARDLYTGTLCRLRREYAEAWFNSDPEKTQWFILSAKYGLLHPDTVVEPYESTLEAKGRPDRAAWSLSVASALVDEIEDDNARLKLHHVEIHAGKLYAQQLQRVLRSVGFTVCWWSEGLGIGDQQKQYKVLEERRGREDQQWCWDASTGLTI